MEKLIVLFIILVVTVASAVDDGDFRFTQEDINVRPNETVDLDCGINGDYRYCVWEHGHDIFQTEDIHEGVYSGMRKPSNILFNQCGIILDSASTEDHGVWTCKIFIRGGSFNDSKKVNVLIKPKPAKITPEKLTVNAGEETNVECTVMAARPAVQLKWRLGDEDITEHSEFENTPVTPVDTFMTVSTLKRTFKPIENEKELKCVVSHELLKDDEVTMLPIIVKYAPIGSKLQTFYEIKEGDDYEIRVNFTSNPKPSKILWKYGESFDALTNEVQNPIDDDENMMTTLQTWGNGHFTAILKISSLNAEDIQRKYNLFVKNEIGSTDFQVMLFSGKMSEVKPEEKNNLGGIIGSIIAALLVVIIVVLVYMKKKKKWLFSRKTVNLDSQGEADC